MQTLEAVPNLVGLVKSKLTRLSQEFLGRFLYSRTRKLMEGMVQDRGNVGRVIDTHCPLFRMEAWRIGIILGRTVNPYQANSLRGYRLLLEEGIYPSNKDGYAAAKAAYRKMGNLTGQRLAKAPLGSGFTDDMSLQEQAARTALEALQTYAINPPVGRA